MIRRALPFAALALPLAAAGPLAANEPTYGGGNDRVASKNAPQPRPQDRQRPGAGNCPGCTGPVIRRPLLEAPAPALLMIPAAFTLDQF